MPFDALIHVRVLCWSAFERSAEVDANFPHSYWRGERPLSVRKRRRELLQTLPPDLARGPSLREWLAEPVMTPRCRWAQEAGVDYQRHSLHWRGTYIVYSNWTNRTQTTGLRIKNLIEVQYGVIS